jgi:Flp pilus assembly pilin Flp
MNVRNALRKFAEDESGQTTAEYVLILVVIVTIIMQFKKGIAAMLKKLLTKMDEGVEEVMVP